MFLSGLIHRQRLFEVTTRWFAGQLQRDDGRFLSQLFVYERLLLEPALRRLLAELAKAQDGTASPAPHWQRLADKDALRALLAADPRTLAVPQGAAQCLRLTEMPEELFPQTPADLAVALRAADDGLRIAGILRIKRLRRLSQKASRLLAGHLAAHIRKAARELARERAAAAGVPLDGFFTPPEAMAAEFTRAEHLVSHAVGDGVIRFAPADLTIDDVLGLRLLGDDAEALGALEASVQAHPRLTVLRSLRRSEAPEGDRALLVSLALPPVDELLAPLTGLDWTFAAHRGLDPDELAAGVRSYVESGAREVQLELRLTALADWLEQELGPNPPEARLAEERQTGGYRGRIAENAAYLIEHLLMLAVSPQTELEGLPFRLWGRYLPDAVALIVGRLFGARPPAAESFAVAP